MFDKHLLQLLKHDLKNTLDYLVLINFKKINFTHTPPLLIKNGCQMVAVIGPIQWYIGSMSSVQFDPVRIDRENNEEITSNALENEEDQMDEEERVGQTSKH